MVAMNEATWIEANVEVVKNYLKKEFENFAIAHQASQSLEHTFTVTDGKKLFKLFIGWPILADRVLRERELTAYQNRTLPRKCDYMERTGITGRLQIRTHPPLRQRRLCVFEEKKAHPLSLFEARVGLR